MQFGPADQTPDRARRAVQLDGGLPDGEESPGDNVGKVSHGPPDLPDGRRAPPARQLCRTGADDRLEGREPGQHRPRVEATNAALRAWRRQRGTTETCELARFASRKHRRALQQTKREVPSSSASLRLFRFLSLSEATLDTVNTTAKLPRCCAAIGHRAFCSESSASL